MLAGLIALSGFADLTPARAAADAPIEKRLREAVRLPQIDLRVGWGFTNAQDWLSEPAVADPPVELERLRARLKGGPSDAPTLSEIARITALLDEPEAAFKSRKEAFEAWQRWAEAAPDNREARLGYARALREIGQFEEATRLLRRLLTEEETSWETRYELATTLGHWTIFELSVNPDGTPGALVGGRLPETAQVERTAERLGEALRLADQLVASAPENPLGWARRARLRTNQALLNFVRGDRGEGRKEGRRFYSALFPAEALPDLEATLRLRPDDPRLVFACLVHRLGPTFLDLMESATTRRGPSGFDALDAETRRAMTETGRRLEQIAEHADPAIAASSLFHAALTGLIGPGGLAAAGPLAARAFELNPHHTEALEMALIALLAVEKPDWRRAEELVRLRLKVRPNDAHARLTLLRLLDEQGRDPEAVKESHEALKMVDHDAALQLAHVELHVRLGNWPSGSADEIRSLLATRTCIIQMPNGPNKANLLADYTVTLAVLKALAGDVPAARQDLEALVGLRPDHEYARKVRELLREMPTRGLAP